MNSTAEQIHQQLNIKIAPEIQEHIDLVRRLAAQLKRSCPASQTLITEELPLAALWNLVPSVLRVQVFGVDQQSLKLALAEVLPSQVEISGYQGLIRININNSTIPLDISRSNTSNFRERLCQAGFNVSSLAYDPLNNSLLDPCNALTNVRQGTVEINNLAYFGQKPQRVLEGLMLTAKVHFKFSATSIHHLKEIAENWDFSMPESNTIWATLSSYLKTAIKPSLGLNYLQDLGLRYRLFPALLKFDIDQRERQWKLALYRIDRAAKIIRTRSSLDCRDQELLLLTALLAPLMPIAGSFSSIVAKQSERLADDVLGSMVTRMGLPIDLTVQLKNSIIAVHLVTDALVKKKVIPATEIKSRLLRITPDILKITNTHKSGSPFDSIQKPFRRIKPQNNLFMEQLFEVWAIAPFFDRAFFDLQLD